MLLRRAGLEVERRLGFRCPCEGVVQHSDSPCLSLFLSAFTRPPSIHPRIPAKFHPSQFHRPSTTLTTATRRISTVSLVYIYTTAPRRPTAGMSPPSLFLCPVSFVFSNTKRSRPNKPAFRSAFLELSSSASSCVISFRILSSSSSSFCLFFYGSFHFRCEFIRSPIHAFCLSVFCFFFYLFVLFFFDFCVSHTNRSERLCNRLSLKEEAGKSQSEAINRKGGKREEEREK